MYCVLDALSNDVGYNVVYKIFMKHGLKATFVLYCSDIENGTSLFFLVPYGMQISNIINQNWNQTNDDDDE